MSKSNKNHDNDYDPNVIRLTVPKKKDALIISVCLTIMVSIFIYFIK